MEVVTVDAIVPDTRLFAIALIVIVAVDEVVPSTLNASLAAEEVVAVADVDARKVIAGSAFA